MHICRGRHVDTCTATRARAYTRPHEGGVGRGGEGGYRRISRRPLETEVDKQTCPTSAGTPKTRQRRAGGAVKREIRDNEPSGQVFDCPAGGLRREAEVLRWKLICRDEKYRRRRARHGNAITADATATCVSINAHAGAQSERF